MSESALERLDDCNVLTVRPDGCVRGEVSQLEAVHEDIDRALKGERGQAHSPADLNALSTLTDGDEILLS